MKNLVSPQVSVIVCTKGRPRVLRECIGSVLANDDVEIELVVVDQSPESASREVVQGFAERRLVLIRTTTTGKSRALNAALRRVRADVVAFTDDDCTVPTGWLARALEVFAKHPDAGIVFGALAAMPHDPGRVFVPMFLPDRYRLITRESLRGPLDTGVGANMFVRRSVFDRIGGFDEWVGPGSRFRSGDDHDLALRALRAGFSLIQDPTNVVVHFGGRSHQGGDARATLHANYYGMGAVYARQLRRGDIQALTLFAGQAAWVIGFIARNALHGRSQLGIRRLAYLGLGAVQGFVAPRSLDAPTSVMTAPAKAAR
ncbi:MAG: glycosyltransferase family 2 protein [Candidatus Limnocylindria bacterium]